MFQKNPPITSKSEAYDGPKHHPHPPSSSRTEFPSSKKSIARSIIGRWAWNKREGWGQEGKSDTRVKESIKARQRESLHCAKI
jgi:hypothetical protein